MLVSCQNSQQVDRLVSSRLVSATAWTDCCGSFADDYAISWIGDASSHGTTWTTMGRNDAMRISRLDLLFTDSFMAGFMEFTTWTIVYDETRFAHFWNDVEVEFLFHCVGEV